MEPLIPQIRKGLVEVLQLVPQERIEELVVEQMVAFLASSLKEGIV